MQDGVDREAVDSALNVLIVDEDGNTLYEDDELELGWADEYEAQRQARYLESREGGHYWVQEQELARE